MYYSITLYSRPGSYIPARAGWGANDTRTVSPRPGQPLQPNNAGPNYYEDVDPRFARRHVKAALGVPGENRVTCKKICNVFSALIGFSTTEQLPQDCSYSRRKPYPTIHFTRLSNFRSLGDFFLFQHIQLYPHTQSNNLTILVLIYIAGIIMVSLFGWGLSPKPESSQAQPLEKPTPESTTPAPPAQTQLAQPVSPQVPLSLRELSIHSPGSSHHSPSFTGSILKP
ncbi:Actin cortical patch SUR7/pH-response regulator PalI [Penicillium freii]|nr:Actin cortical patch SUR7/pH-response regulator PalI [Penicillium freii]